MAIRFRCEHCNQLMSIASRQAGLTVPCPACARDVVVPQEDQFVPQPAASQIAAPAAERRAVPAEAAHVVSSTGGRGPLLENEADDEAGFRLRPVRSELGEMDLTPMVDVTFLLLIFFMVTASFSLQKSIEVPIPDPDREGATQSIQKPEDMQENSVIVRIDEHDGITVDFEPLADAGDLVDVLLDKRTAQKNDLVIDAHELARHGTVVLVNDAAVEAQFQHIRLAVRSIDD